MTFKHEGRVSSVEMSNGFKIFMEELKEEEQERIKSKDSFINAQIQMKKSESVKADSKEAKEIS